MLSECHTIERRRQGVSLHASSQVANRFPLRRALGEQTNDAEVCLYGEEETPQGK